MTLEDYLAKYNYSVEEFACVVGVHPTTIYRLLSNHTRPNKKNLVKIVAVTGDEVDIISLIFKPNERRRSNNI